MTLFRLDASIVPATSTTRALGDVVEAAWAAARPQAEVFRRDLATEPVAADAWQHSVGAAFTAEEDRTAAQRDAQALSTSLAEELISAEALLLDVPLYNYGVSQHFKTWFDVAYNDPRIGPTGTALNGKPAVLVTALGGNYDPGTPKEGWDHSTPWLRRVLEDVWGLDLRVIQRPFTFVGMDPALDQFKDMAEELQLRAEEDARRAGQEIAASALSAVS